MESTELNKLVIIAARHYDLLASLKLCLFFFYCRTYKTILISCPSGDFVFPLWCVIRKYNSFSWKIMQLKGIFLTSNGLALYTLAWHDRVFHINCIFLALKTGLIILLKRIRIMAKCTPQPTKQEKLWIKAKLSLFNGLVFDIGFADLCHYAIMNILCNRQRLLFTVSIL